MPTIPFATVLCSLNGGANNSGGLVAPSAATVQLLGSNTSGWVNALWQMTDFPAGFTAPAGWSTDAGGIIFYAGNTPPLFTLPANTVRWGKWMFKLTVNGGIDEFGVFNPSKMIDTATCLSMLSPKGQIDTGAGEGSQFGGVLKGVTGSLQSELRALEPQLSGGGSSVTGTGWWHSTAGVLDAAAVRTIAAPAFADPNSLVIGDISQDEWQPMTGTAPFMRANAGVSLDGANDATLINWPGATASYVLGTPFSPPPGVTGVVFEADMSLFPTGDASSTVELRITDITGVTTIGSGFAAVLGASMATFATATITVTPGTLYQARIIMGSGLASAHTQALVGRVRVRPVTVVDTFYTSGFTRYGAAQKLLWDNGREGLSTAGTVSSVPYRRQTPMSRFCFITDAPKIGLQLFNLTGNSTNTVDSVTVSVNGRPWAKLTGAVNTHDVQFVSSLPVGPNRIEVTTSAHMHVTNADSVGDFLLSVLAPTSAWMQILEPTWANDRILIIGDSKDGGFYGSTPTWTGWPALMRKQLPSASIVVEASGSLQVFHEGLTEATTEAWAARMAQYKPTKLLFCLGRNDWSIASIPPVDVGARVGQFVDAFHAALPSCAIYIKTTQPESAEAANGLGFTLPNYRTALQNVSIARSQWCGFIDGTTIPSYNSTYTTDGVHPDDRGQSLIMQGLFTQLDAPSPAIALGYAQIFYAPTVAAAGTFAPKISTPLATEVLGILVKFTAYDATAGKSAERILFYKAMNIAGTITIAAAVTVADSTDAGITITPVLTAASGNLVLTTTNGGANSISLKYEITINR